MREDIRHMELDPNWLSELAQMLIPWDDIEMEDPDDSSSMSTDGDLEPRNCGAGGSRLGYESARGVRTRR